MKVVLDCPTCESHNMKIVACLDQDRLDRFLDYSVRKYGGLLSEWIDSTPPVVLGCSSCGHMWYQFQPDADQLDLMYASGRPLQPGAALSREPTESMLQDMRRLRACVRNAHPRMLDYGSGFGRWARAATREGFDVYAYEPSVTRGAEVTDEFTLVHDIASLNGMHFDAINLEQVLEHIPDPFTALESLRAFCSPTTLLRITVPNILRAPERDNLWDVWPYDGFRVHTMAPYEHLHGFTPSSLVSLITRSGYRPLSLSELWRHYPMLVVRNLLSRAYPPAGKTMLLVRPVG